MKRIDDIQPDHLGSVHVEDATVEQFKRACRAALALPDIDDEEAAIDYIWNEGQFDVRIRELLGEEPIL